MNIYHPIALFSEWFSEVQLSGIKEPMAVCLATSSKGGIASARMVLLKQYNEEGFVIYTNMESRKGRELKENPRAALCFYWQHLGKQVRIEGHIEEVSREEADSYFNSRAVNSKIGAWASKQSQPMRHKYDLIKRVAKYTALWASGQIERPPYWTGVRLVPHCFEFLYEHPNDIVEHKQFMLQEACWSEVP